ncbi:MAG: holo-ACP synthase [Anaerolineae bacterium]|nr:holo-ACP synthase [Anaerolineae bacterium]
MLAVGVDVVEVARVERVVRRFGDRFLTRIYTDEERAHCRGQMPRLAARWAAKEAIAKALGTGVAGFCFRDLEVVADAAGRPEVRLHGAARARAEALGLRQWVVSLSHTDTLAVAFVVASG